MKPSFRSFLILFDELTCPHASLAFLHSQHYPSICRCRRDSRSFDSIWLDRKDWYVFSIMYASALVIRESLYSRRDVQSKTSSLVNPTFGPSHSLFVSFVSRNESSAFKLTPSLPACREPRPCPRHRSPPRRSSHPPLRHEHSSLRNRSLCKLERRPLNLPQVVSWQRVQGIGGTSYRVLDVQG